MIETPSRDVNRNLAFPQFPSESGGPQLANGQAHPTYTFKGICGKWQKPFQAAYYYYPAYGFSANWRCCGEHGACPEGHPEAATQLAAQVKRVLENHSKLSRDWARRNTCPKCQKVLDWPFAQMSHFLRGHFDCASMLKEINDDYGHFFCMELRHGTSRCSSKG
jgi:hypothetical protein